MLIVKPYGRSFTSENSKTRKLNARFKNQSKIYDIEEFNSSDPRILIAQCISVIDKIFRKPNQSDEDTNSNRVKNRKNNPGKNDKRRKRQIELRTKLGNLWWELVIEKTIPESQRANFRKIWDWKLNPAGSDYTRFENDVYSGSGKNKKLRTLNYKGHWYHRFFNDQDPEDLTPDDLMAVVDPIYQHLFQLEAKKHGDNRDRHRSEDGSWKSEPAGLIENRANSIAQSTLANRYQKLLENDHLKNLLENPDVKGWSPDDERAFGKHSDLAKEIFNKNSEQEDNDRRIDSRGAADIIFEHYRAQFEQIGKVPSRLEIRETDEGLLNIYDVVRGYYKKLLKNTKKGTAQKGKGKRNSKLSVILPRNNNALFQKIRQKTDNSIVNDLIRIGRVLHYESTAEGEDGFGVSKNALKSPEDIKDSPYWTSAGQMDIKRTENFIRIWRSALSEGARTAKYLADPQGTVRDKEDRPSDVLGQEEAKKICTNGLDLDHAKRQRLLLFGNAAGRFPATDDDLKAFVYALLRSLANIRNKTFHFGNRRKFTAALKTAAENFGDWGKLSGYQNFDKLFDEIKALIREDQKSRLKRVYSTIEGAQIHRFVGARLLGSYLDLIARTSDETDIPLPKFNKLLLRLANTGELKMGQNGWSLCEPASESKLKNPAKLAKFIGLKQLYEKPFQTYLSNLTNDALNKYIKNAKVKGTEAARTINKKSEYVDLICAKTEALPDLDSLASDYQNLHGYMTELQAFQASEMRVQKGYESDSQAAKKQMEWIERFRNDIIGQAFKDFLLKYDSVLGWLLKLKDSSQPNHDYKMPAPEPETADKLQDDWHCTLYFMLHLIPADSVSLLLHQFKKWNALERKGNKEVLEESGDTIVTKDENAIDELKSILTLYLDMNNDKHTGEGIETRGLEEFSAFYESEELFKKTFSTQDSDNERLASTRRHLRQILRFGHFKVLEPAFAGNKVKADDLVALDKLEALQDPANKTSSEIAVAQAKRTSLHDRIMTKRNWDESDVDNYIGYLKIITKHQSLSNKARLVHLVQLHKILMRVISRLVDYSATWERDGYFLSLAIISLLGKQPTDVFSGKDDDKRDIFEKFCTQGQLPNNINKIDENLLCILKRFYTIDQKATRNDLAHFNVLSGADINLTDQINRVRSLLAYDRKLKNAISKSVYDILQQEGLSIEWQVENHTLGKAEVGTLQIEHLNRNGISQGQKKQLKIDRHEIGFVEMVKKLLS